MNVEILQGAQLSELAALDAGALPTEFRLFKFGDNATTKGVYKLDEDGARTVMATYQQHGVELAIDYEHDTFNDKLSGPRPAAGWFTPEVRGDGLYATNVRWTPRAAEALRAREYRYFSPTFGFDKQRRIVKLMPLALVNFPASHDQPALVAASAAATDTTTKRDTMDVTKIVGLKDDASEADISARLEALAAGERKLLEHTGKKTLTEAFDSLAAQKRATDLAVTEAETLGKRLASLEDDKWSGELAKLRDEFRITPAEVADYVACTGVERDTARKLLKNRPVMKPAAQEIDRKEGGGGDRFEKAKTAMAEYLKANPEASSVDAYAACAAKNPELFAEEV